MRELYTDGGVIGRNPSPQGGTFAWCRVENDFRVQELCRVVRPADIGSPVVSNNNAELLALLDGIEALPEGWTGRVNSDSQVALGWVFLGWKQDAIPTALRTRLQALRRSGRLVGLEWRLLQGHPTQADLARGIGAKRNLPVSIHNQWCDQACSRLAREDR